MIQIPIKQTVNPHQLRARHRKSSINLHRLNEALANGNVPNLQSPKLQLLLLVKTSYSTNVSHLCASDLEDFPSEGFIRAHSLPPLAYCMYLLNFLWDWRNYHNQSMPLSINFQHSTDTWGLRYAMDKFNLRQRDFFTLSFPRQSQRVQRPSMLCR